MQTNIENDNDSNPLVLTLQSYAKNHKNRDNVPFSERECVCNVYICRHIPNEGHRMRTSARDNHQTVTISKDTHKKKLRFLCIYKISLFIFCLSFATTLLHVNLCKFRCNLLFSAPQCKTRHKSLTF